MHSQTVYQKPSFMNNVVHSRRRGLNIFNCCVSCWARWRHVRWRSCGLELYGVQVDICLELLTRHVEYMFNWVDCWNHTRLHSKVLSKYRYLAMTRTQRDVVIMIRMTNDAGRLLFVCCDDDDDQMSKDAKGDWSSLRATNLDKGEVGNSGGLAQMMYLWSILES